MDIATLNSIKARCFDLNEANTQLGAVLGRVARLVQAPSVDQILPRLEELLANENLVDDDNATPPDGEVPDPSNADTGDVSEQKDNE